MIKYLKENVAIITILIFSILFFIISKGNYLLFHTVIELLPISLGVSLLLIAITKIKLKETSSFEFLSLGFFGVATIDLLHTLAFKGMGVFKDITANEPTKLWILARVLMLVVIFVYILIEKKSKGEKISNRKIVMFSLFLLTYITIGIISIFYIKIFPDCFIEGKGLTKFKIFTEYFIIIFLGGALLLMKNFVKDDIGDFKVAVTATMLSELLFTVYTDVYGVTNMLGHIFKFMAFVYMFRFVMKNVIENQYILRLEEKVKAENREKQYFQIIEAISDCLYIVDKKGNIKVVNSSSVKALGYSKSEFESMHLSQIDVPEFAELVPERMNLIEKNGSAVFETIHITKVGNKIPMEVNASKINVDNEECIVSICRNMEDRKKYEKQLKELKETAEKANKAKSEFLSNMSHEIRTPMNGINGFTDILYEVEENVERREILSIIKESSNHLLSIINDILSLSKIEAGMYKTIEEKTNIFDKIVLISKSYERQSKFKKIEYKSCIDESLNRQILIDEHSVLSIVNNLMSNSLKFTNEGYISLEIKDIEQRKIEITVSDTGIGINEEKQKHLYEAFEQGEHFLTKHYGGTGLGLTLIKRMVDLLNGEISVSTEVGKGTEFKVTVFYKEVKEEVINKNENDEKLSIDHRIKIISAEDEETNQKLLEMTLKNKASVFKRVYNGQELLDELEINQYDLILLDIQMPVLNGIDVTKIIRNNQKYRDIVIIAVSAYAFEENIQEMMDAGVDDYLSKPVKKKELIEMINKWGKKRLRKDN